MYIIVYIILDLDATYIFSTSKFSFFRIYKEAYDLNIPPSSLKRYRKESLINTKFYSIIMNNIFSVVVHKEKKYYVAECPEIGTVSQGKTIEESIKNLKEATELYLEEFPIKKTSKPFVSFFEVTTYGKASKTIRA